MDTGLGAKAYAIIEQGKIGMILSSRPADRRQLIEEAAGITKYKARRRAAELKLEAAHAEPDAPRRHHLRARKAVRIAQAPVRESAPLQAAARRAAALGEAAVRAALSGGGAEDRISCARAWPTRASARRPRRQRWPRPSRISAVFACRSSRPKARRPARARRSTPASSTSTGVSSRLSSTASRLRRLPRAPKKCAQSWPRSRRAASRDGPHARRSGAKPRLRRSRTSSRQPQRAGAHRIGIRRREPAHRRARSRRRSGAIGSVLRAQRGDDAASCDSARRRSDAAGVRRAREARRWKNPKSGWNTSGSKAIARRRPTGCAVRRKRPRRRCTRRPRARPSWRRTRIELEWKSNNLQVARARARRPDGAPRVADRSRGGARRIHRSGAHGARAGQRARRPAGLGRRLPRRRAEVRARGRSVPRRPAAARHRADAPTGRGRTGVDSAGKRRALRIRRAGRCAARVRSR